MKKTFQRAEDRIRLMAQNTQDVVKNQVQYIDELEEDLSEYISPSNQALFKIFEQNAQRNLDIPLDLFPKVLVYDVRLQRSVLTHTYNLEFISRG